MAAAAPLLAVSSLRGADGVDDTAVKYLLRAELKKEEEEEEERKQELADEVLDDKLEAEFDALMAIGHLTSRQEARLSAVVRERLELVERRKKRRTMRKRKKRRKRKTPKTSFSCGRAHRRQQQCYVHDWFSWCCSSRCVLSFGRQTQDATPGPLCTRRTVISGLCMAGFLCAVFPFIVGRPCGAFSGQVVLARRCATTGAGPGPDSVQLCPWRLHRRSSWTSLLSREQVDYGS